MSEMELMRFLGAKVVLTPAADKGSGMLAKAIELSEARGAMPDLGITHLHAAEILTDLHDHSGVAPHRDKAAQIFSSADMPWWEHQDDVREQETLIQFPKRA